MVEQSANDMNQIKEQSKDVENQADVSGQKIKEPDAGHQTLVEKISGMENSVADRLEDLAKADASLLAKLSALESTNDQTVHSATAGLEKKIHDAEHRLGQSSKTETQPAFGGADQDQQLEHREEAGRGRCRQPTAHGKAF